MYPQHPVARSRRMGSVGVGVDPASIAVGIASDIAKLFGGIHGEQYSTVEMESVYNAALAGDWANVTLVANGGVTNGFPYQNSDGKGGWASPGHIDWSAAGYSDVRNFAATLVRAFIGGASLPSPTTPATRNYAQLQTEVAKMANVALPLPAVTTSGTGSPMTAQTNSDLMRAAAALNVVDPALLQQVASGSLTVSQAAAAQAAKTSQPLSASLASLSPTVKAIGLGLGAFILLDLMRKK